MGHKYEGDGESDDLLMFYYFIESERSPENDPLILRLTGGPACSSFALLLKLFLKFLILPFKKNTCALHMLTSIHDLTEAKDWDEIATDL
ncbi:Peptidase S10, serine carboxypeptidase [Parasponia andersonii]|uniref:Peptidase S10, serine carboxypeptidase n=1 Tax=Parasponia andersonii TaxID=3476 RepID=A0A2P5CXS1_PARAD|nr:Peptidase S10, serine carboxypeptidase [Parasponia andersonii]